MKASAALGSFAQQVPKVPATTWPWIAVAQWLLIATVACVLAVALNPAPHSDWAYYWRAAGEADQYHRGGVGLWILAIPKELGFSPASSALIINLSSSALLLWLTYRADIWWWRPFAQIVAFYLFLITPFFGIVQLDLLAAALQSAAFFLLLQRNRSKEDNLTKPTVVAAFLLVVSAVSTKPQLALVLWTLLFLMLLLRWCLRGRWRPPVGTAVAILLLASLAGFALDYAMRMGSGRTETMRTSSAVTLYGGLLVSSTAQGCGNWSVEAAEAAKADMRKPLAVAIGDRLAARPISQWLAVIACKVPQILIPPPYAVYWLMESPNVRAAIERRPDRERVEATYRRVLFIERFLHNAAVLIILAIACIGFALHGGAQPSIAALAPLWILSFWAVHAIFEIQGRYFLPMLLLTPLLVALAQASGRSGANPRRSGGLLQAKTAPSQSQNLEAP